ncbi:alpha-D-ribose 1-methylphosphonate 5-triphosphate diphosphatase [Pseudanabaena sp. PCC 6802]|uniref:alpha-D-ribose 1-methylphosphonate 5-triphosphate diphosphatase n=1 Tax=Pseudanabaena sp. PCC 6802 TaxID=118173 RepID=UPI000346E745|nr:alpha-D-ribose 1-methylphosphonate 5-triphosphate diphosphatase [Pseudanabaena sp. PCC 6802]
MERTILEAQSRSKQLDDRSLSIQGVDVLTPNGWLKDATVLVEDGKFASIDSCSSPNGSHQINTKGLQMLPGIVDIHGDAFERAIAPRPGVNFPISLAIAENDRQLIAAGITTFFYSITDSYEPGLRSREMARNLLDFILDTGKSTLRCNSYIHIRHELANTDCYDELCDWLKSGRVHMLSLNDHLPPPGNPQKLLRHLKGLRRRLSLTDEEIDELFARIELQREPGHQQVKELVELAHSLRIPVASHDDDSEEKVALSQSRGVAIAEFPSTVELAANSRAYGAAVLMGAPNLVRGGSHLGWMNAADALRAGVLDILCSDYHYPSLFHAPFKLQELGLMPFEQAWELVSGRPAVASGLGDRKGKIAPTYDADFLLVQPGNAMPSAIAAVYVAGRPIVQYASLC